MTNLSHLFENNLRKASEVGVVCLPAMLSTGGDRLGQAAEYVKAGENYIAYTIPADSIVSKVYFIVDEAFAAGTTAAIATLKGIPTVVAAALDLATVGASVSAASDLYFDAADGFSITLNQASQVGKVRVVAEFISASTNTGMYVELGA